MQHMTPGPRKDRMKVSGHRVRAHTDCLPFPIWQGDLLQLQASVAYKEAELSSLRAQQEVTATGRTHATHTHIHHHHHTLDTEVRQPSGGSPDPSGCLWDQASLASEAGPRPSLSPPRGPEVPSVYLSPPARPDPRHTQTLHDPTAGLGGAWGEPHEPQGVTTQGVTTLRGLHPHGGLAPTPVAGPSIVRGGASPIRKPRRPGGSEGSGTGLANPPLHASEATSARGGLVRLESLAVPPPVTWQLDPSSAQAPAREAGPLSGPRPASPATSLSPPQLQEATSVPEGPVASALSNLLTATGMELASATRSPVEPPAQGNGFAGFHSVQPAPQAFPTPTTQLEAQALHTAAQEMPSSHEVAGHEAAPHRPSPSPSPAGSSHGHPSALGASVGTKTAELRSVFDSMDRNHDATVNR